MYRIYASSDFLSQIIEKRPNSLSHLILSILTYVYIRCDPLKCLLREFEPFTMIKILSKKTKPWLFR